MSRPSRGAFPNIEDGERRARTMGEAEASAKVRHLRQGLGTWRWSLSLELEVLDGRPGSRAWG